MSWTAAGPEALTLRRHLLLAMAGSIAGTVPGGAHSDGRMAPAPAAALMAR